jgi:hypothetical protein
LHRSSRTWNQAAIRYSYKGTEYVIHSLILLVVGALNIVPLAGLYGGGVRFALSPTNIQAFWVDNNFPSPHLAQEALAKEALAKGILHTIEREMPSAQPAPQPQASPSQPMPVVNNPTNNTSTLPHSTAVFTPLPKPGSVDDEEDHLPNNCIDLINSICQTLLESTRPHYDLTNVAGQFQGQV